MKKVFTLIVIVAALLWTAPVIAQAPSFEGHVTSSLQTVEDANGVDTALQVSTGGIAVNGSLSATGTITLPEGGLVLDDLGAVAIGEVVLCGDSVSASTTYWGPATDSWEYGGADYSISSTACDALDSTTEATADAPIMTNVAFKVMGMYCKVTSSGSNGVTMTLRSAAANTTPAISCTIATGDTDCFAAVSSTTDIAAGATIAVKQVTTEDLSAADGWCKVFVGIQG